ncbi:avidin/streptavidin family protein [Frateuria sp. Soil773]|uniref:avidin/streptavidin family protein n=1 Tax=Frateuria sp. Soil773 TaxID=1736407 RepID=UPI00138F55E3|nr:avidin/streptavidin family protein [Frateuria sp. Soil773]
MKNTIRGLLAMLVLASTSVFADSIGNEAIKALSVWTNQNGSTLYIDSISDAGQISGRYINRATGYNCRDIAYPVVGWIYGTAISFATLWQSQTESCNSITSWTGFYYKGQISTLWQLTINGSTSPKQILKGSDIFKQAAKSDKKSLVR